MWSKIKIIQHSPLLVTPPKSCDARFMAGFGDTGPMPSPSIKLSSTSLHTHTHSATEWLASAPWSPKCWRASCLRRVTPRLGFHVAGSPAPDDMAAAAPCMPWSVTCHVCRLWGTLDHRENGAKTSQRKKEANGNSLIPRWPELMHPLRAPSASNSIRPRSSVAARVEETVAWRTSTVSSAKRCGSRSTEATRCG